jgi:hypothetical protein
MYAMIISHDVRIQDLQASDLYTYRIQHGASMNSILIYLGSGINICFAPLSCTYVALQDMPGISALSLARADKCHTRHLSEHISYLLEY